MGDSDDEYDRRRRDKFRRERSDYDRSRERDDRRRDDWSERDWDRGRERRNRGEYREYDRGRRERFSPPRHEMSPPPSRMRRDWDDHGVDSYHGGYDMGYGAGPSYAPPQHWGHPEALPMQPLPGIPIQARLGHIHDVNLGSSNSMKTFKEFLHTLDDSVDETEAVSRFNSYKLDFRRQQMQDFFLAHKEEEWFKAKYHPDDLSRLRAESQNNLRSRLSVFTYLMENGWFNNVSLDIDQTVAIIKLLDAAVIRLEGGSEFDLGVLDSYSGYELEIERGNSPPASTAAEDQNREHPNAASAAAASSKENNKAEKASDAGDGMGAKLDEMKAASEDKDAAAVDEPKPKKARGKRKHSGKRDDERSASESESDSDSNFSVKPKIEEKEGDDAQEEKPKDNREADQAKEEKPRALHKTSSLFMRSIAPNISKAELISLFSRFSGFLRICLSEPHPERSFFRRCWATFGRNVNIKEVCWNLQNARLRDCELVPGVNRDLARRVRHVNGITQHKQVVRNDIKLAAKLIQFMDEKRELWTAKTADDDESSEIKPQNPIVKNITDYLIEEVSAEEEELLGNVMDLDDGLKDGNPLESSVEKDEKLAKVLDRLVIYLRIVHSVDYYNTCEYPNEDDMPNRCGMIHVRGPVPPNRVSLSEVQQWQKLTEEKLAPLFSSKEVLTKEEAIQMGRKDPKEEVEKFITANTQELGKDKWLCPLSGKKFKGPEFVRKHIVNKHAEKIEEVKKEVTFFNNFLMDAKRPTLPEMKLAPFPTPGLLSPTMPFPAQGPVGFAQAHPPLMGYAGGHPYPPNQFGSGRGGYDGYRGHSSHSGHSGYQGKQRNPRSSRGDPRNILEYRDLDAPDDTDFF